MQGNLQISPHALAELTAAVQRLQAGDFSARLSEPDGPVELADLARALNSLADALRQRESERQQLEKRFRAAFESSAIGMGLLALDGKILAVNAAVCQMSGYSEQDLLGRYDYETVYPPDAEVGMDRLAEMLAGKRGYYNVERRYVRKNGEVFWARLTLSLVRDAQGQPAYLVGMIEDIDDQKRKEAVLAQSEARFQAMFDNMTVGTAIMSLERRLLDANQAAVRMTGYSLAELRNTDPLFLSHPDDLEIGQKDFMRIVAGEIPGMQMEKRYIRKDGSVFWGRVTYSAVLGPNGKPAYLVGLIEDITEAKQAAERLARQEAEHRRQLEQRIAERTAELNAANERLRDKAALDAVAAERIRLARDLHDAVTQTLFSTTLIAEVLPDLWEMNPAEGRRRLEELRQLTRGALAEMRTLLVELRPNALTEIPLPTLLRQLTEAMAGRSRIAIQLSAEGECKLPPDVQVALYRIAQEALNNVVKHARASQAIVTLRLCNPVRLTIADDGAGFDPAAVTADHLGLRIMRERAEAIGAKLSVYSEPGEGTQVSVVWEGGS